MSNDHALYLITRLKYPLLLLVWLFTLPGYPSGQARIDSLANTLKSEQNPLKRLGKMLLLAENEYNYQTAVSFAESAINLADSLRIETDKAKALTLSGIAWKNWGDNSKSVDRLFAALDIYQRLNDQTAIANVLMNIGETFRASNNHQQSLEYLNKALGIYEKTNDTRGLARTYNRLAATNYEILYTLPDFEKLVNESYPAYADFYQEVISDSRLKRALDNSSSYIDSADHYAKLSKLDQLMVSDDILRAAIYSATNQLDKALLSYGKILHDIDKTGARQELPLALINLSGIYRKKKDIVKSIDCANQAFEIAQKENIKVYLLMSCYKLLEIYQDMKDYKRMYEMLSIIHLTNEQYHKDDFEVLLSAIRQQEKITTRESEISHRKTQLRFLYIFFSIILLSFSIFIFTLFRKNRRLKLLLQEINKKNQIIRQQNDELSLVNTEKDKFFSILAHDMRGSFNGFLGLTSLMTEELQTMTFEQIKNIALSMKRSATNLYRLLENLLQWASMQQGLIPFRPERVSLRSAATESVNVFHEAAKNKGIDIVYDIPNDLVVSADINILQTIIRNLVSNAVKYTPSGGKINIAASKTGDLSVEVCISDTGIGMSRELVDTLFRLDVQTNRQGTEGEPGTGLGLIICKDFIEKQGGRLLAESEVGKGSRFTFQLELAPATDDSVEKHASRLEPGNGHEIADKNDQLQDGWRLKRLEDFNATVPNILIVDDVPANLRILGDILENDGYKVRPVLSGMQALQVSEKEKPDLVLLDVMMSDMDGFEVCRLFKGNPILSDVPVIFISALNDINDVVKALTAGGADYITKPFQPEEVKARVATHLKIYHQSRELRELNRTLDNRVEARTTQLELTNKELEFHLREIEQFTFITSHDLQEPLLTLTNFTQLIREEYAGKLDEDWNKYLEFINDSANRMKALVKGLLDYALLGKDSTRCNFDSNKLVRDVIHELAGVINANKANLITRELPRLHAYEPELKLLFLNLVTNALKFRRTGVDPEIEISAEIQGKEWIFSVADNGIGIEEKQHEKVFVIFQRLHNRDEFGGIGIGLAHCKKIVEMHGGRIWLETNRNGGSTFRFSIPIVPDIA
ncbi:MAG: ATP-binding protein [Bacteroidetes bacterium]|nr:ATP-binding protein [Bacteroidota bacterium]